VWRPPLVFEAWNFGPTVPIENFIIIGYQTEANTFKVCASSLLKFRIYSGILTALIKAFKNIIIPFLAPRLH